MQGRQVAVIHVAVSTAQDVSRNIRVDHLRDAFERVFRDESRFDRPVGIRVDCHAPEARVTAVQDGSPAALAGVRVGDVILRVGDLQARTGVHYVLALLEGLAGDTIEVVVRREAKVLVLRLGP